MSSQFDSVTSPKAPWVYSMPSRLSILPTDQLPNMLSWQPGWPEATPVSIRRPRPRSRPSPNRAAMRAGGFPRFYFGLDDAAAHT